MRERVRESIAGREQVLLKQVQMESKISLDKEENENENEYITIEHCTFG